MTGLNYYNQKTREFEFRPGPVLNQILLADEINIHISPQIRLCGRTPEQVIAEITETVPAPVVE